MSSYGKWFLVALAAAALTGSAHLAASDVPSPAGDGAATSATTAAPAPRGVELRAIRVGQGAAGPEIALDGNGALSWEAQTLENPRRLVVDLQGVTSKLKTNQLPVGSGGVARVRAGQFRASPEPISRVVFDLDAAVTYEIVPTRNGLKVSFAPPSTENAASEQGTMPATAPAGEPSSTATAASSTAPDAPAAPLPTAQNMPAAPRPTTQNMPVAIAAADSRKSPSSDSAPTPERVTGLAPLEPSAEAAAAPQDPAPSRALAPEAVEKLLRAPVLADQQDEPVERSGGASQFTTRTIVSDQTQYTGRRISLNMVDADIKEIFRLFHEISGLNFVLDPSVEGRVTIVLDQVPWDQALDIILKNNGMDKVLENNVIRIATTTKLATEAASRKQLKEAKELEVEPITVTRTLSYAKAKDVERVIRDGGILSVRGKVIVDERTNALIVSDIPKRVEPLNQLLDTLDSETPQVMIEARIVETSREFSQDVGIKWGFNAISDASRGTSSRLTFPRNSSAKYALNLPGEGNASTLQFKIGNILDSFTLDLALTAIENEGHGRILSSPKIATQNNERAEIEQGVRIPVVNTTATEINVEFVSASLRLAVTPQITAEGTVIMDVTVENNQPDFLNRVGDVPPITTQRAQTKILVSDGGTAVIGGIFTVNEGVSEIGVPWFRKIPGFGWLFKNKVVTNNNRELLIFLTPKILTVG